jgi:hypothetical protein
VPAVEVNPVKLPLRAAMEARDLSAVVDSFAPDAVLHSPFTAKLTFNGRDEIGAVTKVILDVFDDLHYTEELRGENAAVLVSRARVGGEEIEMVDHMRLGPDGKIQEFTVFFRPLPATTAALRLIGAGLGRRKSPARAAIISALARPLAFMTRTGDGIGVRLVRSSMG